MGKSSEQSSLPQEARLEEEQSVAVETGRSGKREKSEGVEKELEADLLMNVENYLKGQKDVGAQVKKILRLYEGEKRQSQWKELQESLQTKRI